MKLPFSLPPSFSALLLFGFVLVALPLLGGIVGMTRALEQMALEGRRSVNVSADITQASRQLGEVEMALKRAAGQFFVLEDPTLKERLLRAHNRFQETLALLEPMPWSESQQQQLTELGALERALYARLENAPATDVFESYKHDFEQLDAATASLSDAATQVIREQVTGMNQTADRIQATMITLALAMILLSLMLSGALSWLLSRPVRQLAATIRRLGQNDLDTPSTVRGPKDLVYLGEQLDWLRHRLQELEEHKLSFFREVSHELKTPLTSLMEAVALLRDEVTGSLNGQQREVVEIMHGSTRDLRQRIEDLLRYNEAVSAPSLSTSRFDLQDLIDEVCARFDLPIRSKSLNCIQQIPALQIDADRSRLAIALENLLGNAIRFSPDNGTVEIRVTQAPGYVEIDVCDQGPGIPDDQAAQLFQPFFKGTQQPRGALKSSGLGLAIAKAHIEQQDGQLTLVPTYNDGACFRVRLPYAQEGSHRD
ncbi:putative sensor-like histidine kinase YfhK [Marinobacterium lacunae]|uniref:histidine kinase n=1 Tax=Marinobacterium lacunae TaxID=1232683 RepID=A0A081FWW9_9GAMM|nr:HAMP domain-containing sensor histidine kinase [Marinobacterium lacunae]KEA63024.1 putative sensor-like histidine kinase YfhK [Marinobacterium lacunae]